MSRINDPTYPMETIAIFPIHLYIPPSISSGLSTIHILYPLSQSETTLQNSFLAMAGWVSPFNTLRCVSSLNTMDPSLGRLRLPSGSKMSSPKCFAIFASTGLPGSTIWRAITSASTTGIPYVLSCVETEDLPVAIPPVRPTTVELSVSQVGKSRDKNAHLACRRVLDVLALNVWESRFTEEFELDSSDLLRDNARRSGCLAVAATHGRRTRLRCAAGPPADAGVGQVLGD